ncbi:mitofusin [Thecaphora frezii]
MSSQQYAATPQRPASHVSPAELDQLLRTPTTPQSKLADPSSDSKLLFRQKELEMQRQREGTDAKALLAEHQGVYEKNKETLLDAIQETGVLLSDLRDYNKNKRIIHYAAATDAPRTPAHPQATLKRSQSTRLGESFADEAHNHHQSEQAHPPIYPSLQRCYTSQSSGSSSLPSTPERRAPLRSSTSPLGVHDEAADDDEMSVLRLDLRVGSVGGAPSPSLVRSLERSSIAQLLDGRMEKSQRHLDNLKQRIRDTQSKVLVTGDLNAGKSTFVNALLRRNLMPTDQQPCTTVFCEVLDATDFNDGVEEVHMLKQGFSYDAKNKSTFTRHTLDEIESIVAEAEDFSPEDAPILKCYARDTRATQDSLLKNGIVDIALIDAPGLNRDSLKTTALFARQEEIDVVVFVVSAENHFTLSAKEFLWNASHDKAYVFIVVNKYDQIRNKEKCRKLVLEQIRQLSPRTYEDAANLVHFVDSGAVFGQGAAAEVEVAAAAAPLQQPPETPQDEVVKKVGGTPVTSMIAMRGSESLRAFARLEASLRDFVLLKRSKSKLLPSKTYMLRLLSDIAFLAKINTEVASVELEEASKALEVARPALARCQASHAKLEGVLEGEEDEVVMSVTQDAQHKLNRAIERIGLGLPAVEAMTLPAYQGLFNVWEYAQEVRHTLTSSLEMALRGVEDTTRGTTSQAVDRVQRMGEAHLPAEVEKRQRIFNPDAMFAKRRSLPGLMGLGLTSDVVEVQPSDFFDAWHHFAVLTGNDGSNNKDEGRSLSSHDEELSLVSSLSLGLGAITLVGGKTFGAKTAVDALVRVSDLIGNPTARRWAGPVFALLSTGLVIYFIVDLPNSVPRNIGRAMKNGLLSGDLVVAAPSSSSTTACNGAAEQRETKSATTAGARSFSMQHSARVGRETRKVLRLATWDLQERFRDAIAQKRKEVEREEAKQKSAEMAIEWFEKTEGKVKHVRHKVEEVVGLESA